MNKQKINDKDLDLSLLEGIFEKKELNELLGQWIARQINQCKIDRWAAWERNHQVDTTAFDLQIEKLREQRAIIETYLSGIEPTNNNKIAAQINVQLKA
ncbi:MAG: hypothetical protein NWP52_05865 [Flavobacteriaceae bacterium]|jgi:hypothetical protein|nr:hypothetical protein [Flavobacteriaceae bacterium]MDP4675021.1 hypothetical protein [Flavobacteriaceae bacterium]MDP4755338.1 hypothetical protein [Flavobacteriaceae bacterium]MDP4793758.1 hypothetical protein [Flavobacteriaceae bacterium]MDP4886269.1 hypothetical protein [Flavobacteriaceae bacterium]